MILRITHRLQSESSKAVMRSTEALTDKASLQLILCGTTTNPSLRTTTLPNNALMMSPRLVMKRLQSNCPAQQTSQRPSFCVNPCNRLTTYDCLHFLRIGRPNLLRFHSVNRFIMPGKYKLQTPNFCD
ncbi:hypothetical protein CRM22_008377 [Opisthorchis felineus]|uniref:Uncharacterized protein n=1 Tax=Opisthorchis felineus TaxID=147828 RepID=A0A4S2LBF9_OPIFE|nr:hypothetical protein CRM22_008377 [Opisthorchis felineus]